MPYQHWNDFVSDDSTESQPPTTSKKSAPTVSLRSLEARFNAQQWIRHLYIPGDRQGNSDRMDKFIDSLEKGDMDLLWAWPAPSPPVRKSGFYDFACLPHKVSQCIFTGHIHINIYHSEFHLDCHLRRRQQSRWDKWYTGLLQRLGSCCLSGQSFFSIYYVHHSIPFSLSGR